MLIDSPSFFFFFFSGGGAGTASWGCFGDVVLSRDALPLLCGSDAVEIAAWVEFIFGQREYGKEASNVLLVQRTM
jgi:hypothetical protein